MYRMSIACTIWKKNSHKEPCEEKVCLVFQWVIYIIEVIGCTHFLAVAVGRKSCSKRYGREVKFISINCGLWRECSHLLASRMTRRWSRKTLRLNSNSKRNKTFQNKQIVSNSPASQKYNLCSNQHKKTAEKCQARSRTNTNQKYNAPDQIMTWNILCHNFVSSKVYGLH